jgi:hypothetical protein
MNQSYDQIRCEIYQLLDPNVNYKELDALDKHFGLQQDNTITWTMLHSLVEKVSL